MAEKIQWLSPERLGVGVGDPGNGRNKAVQVQQRRETEPRIITEDWKAAG